MAQLNRAFKGLFSGDFIVQIAFKKQNFCLPRHIIRNVNRAKFRRDTQIGVHRPLAIGRHKNHRPRGRQIAPRHRSIDKVGAIAGHRLGIEPTQRIVMHTANKGGRQPQISQARKRVGNRPTRCLHTVFHGGIQHLAAIPFHQLHDAFLNPHQLDETVISGGEYIHNGVADADNLIGFHSVLSSKRQ